MLLNSSALPVPGPCASRMMVPSSMFQSTSASISSSSPCARSASIQPRMSPKAVGLRRAVMSFCGSGTSRTSRVGARTESEAASLGGQTDLIAQDASRARRRDVARVLPTRPRHELPGACACGQWSRDDDYVMPQQRPEYRIARESRQAEPGASHATRLISRIGLDRKASHVERFVGAPSEKSASRQGIRQ